MSQFEALTFYLNWKHQVPSRFLNWTIITGCLRTEGGEKLDFYSLKELIIFTDKAKSRRSILLRVSTQINSCFENISTIIIIIIIIIIISLRTTRITAWRQQAAAEPSRLNHSGVAVRSVGLSSSCLGALQLQLSLHSRRRSSGTNSRRTLGGLSFFGASSLFLSLRLISLAYACVVTMVTLRGRGDADRRNGPSTSTGTPARSEIKTRRRKNAPRTQESGRSDVSVSVFGV